MNILNSPPKPIAEAETKLGSTLDPCAHGAQSVVLYYAVRT